MTKSRREVTTTPSTADGSATVDVAKMREHAMAVLANVEGADTVLSLLDALTNERDALAAENERQELRIKQLIHLVYGRKTEAQRGAANAARAGFWRNRRRSPTG